MPRHGSNRLERTRSDEADGSGSAPYLRLLGTSGCALIRVLGTGAADGWPNPFCRCASCMSARALGVVRGQTSVLVDDVLLDFGPETARAAERCGAVLADVRHVLLTHNHPDHTAPAFLLYRSWVTGPEPLDVVGPPSVIEQARMWLAPDTHVAFHEVHPGDELMLGDSVEPPSRRDHDDAALGPRVVRVLDSSHGGDSVLYDVTAPSGRVLYATDTGPLPDATLRAVQNAAFDAVFLEQTFGDFTAHGTAHLDLPSFAEQVRRLRAHAAIADHTQLVAVHLSHHNPPLPELERRLAAYGAQVVPDGAIVPFEPIRPAVVGPSTSAATCPLRTLVIGGARSGKSSEAERLLLASEDVTYVATSYPRSDDPEWVERVSLHQQQRPSRWQTLESLELTDLLTTSGGPLLIDCLTLWLTRVMDRHDAWDDATWPTRAPAVRADIEALVTAWRATTRRVVAVTNEVGQGLVPADSGSRRFRDEMGRLNAAIAAETEDVRLCVAGRVITT